MTFTTRIKDEISKIDNSIVESRTELLIYIKLNGKFHNNELSIFIENASVARRVFKLLKENYKINIGLTIRRQKRFKKAIIYILNIKEKISQIQDDIKLINQYSLDSFEEKQSFLNGLFLACGSINDPKTGSYHLEFFVNQYKDVLLINKVLKSLNINSKYIKREKGYMVYVKAADEISEFIKIIAATNSFFYFEDIRIYRDHKNMVNRLNNCEQANTEKSIEAAMDQIKKINYLNDNDLIELLDEKTKVIADYRIKYPDSSLKELADIISIETDLKITKSGVNHHFRKINELVTRHHK